MSIYLDYNASAPIDNRVLDIMMDTYTNCYGNSDSRTHDYGDNARQMVEKARKCVADLLNCESSEVFFTSGATESDNIAILGLEKYGNQTNKKHIVTTSIEHKAVLESTRQLSMRGFEVEYISPDENGLISSGEVLSSIRSDTLVVSIMHANNETGVIQPVYEIGEELQERDILFHIDATQSCGKLVEEVQSLKYDLLSLTAHKMYGPQGVGALILKRIKHKLPPVQNIMFGGQQEHGIRPGTVPVALVAGFGEACRYSLREYEHNNELCLEIKRGLISVLEDSGLDYSINGAIEHTMPNTLNICVKGVASEALMIATKQYCSISNGSACTSKDYSPSYVLKAMGMADEDILSSIRISWGPKQDKKKVIDNFKQLVGIAEHMV